MGSGRPAESEKGDRAHDRQVEATNATESAIMTLERPSRVRPTRTDPSPPSLAASFSERPSRSEIGAGLHQCDAEAEGRGRETPPA